MTTNSASTTTGLTDTPLTPSVAKPLIIGILQDEAKPMKRDEIARQVVSHHKHRGGTLGQQDPLLVVKKALQKLQNEGSVEKADGFARWKLAASLPARATSDFKPVPRATIQTCEPVQAPKVAQEALPAEISVPAMELGTGQQSVYIYFYPEDKESAQHRGKNVWPCKIGKNKSPNPSRRVLGQGAKTARAHPATIALILKTHDCDALERAIHGSLDLIGARVDGGGGREWFETNPSRIEAWFPKFRDALALL